MTHAFVTIRATAMRLNVHENTIRNWVDKGILKARRLPTGTRRIPAAEVDRMERQMFEMPSSLYDQPTTPMPKSVHETAQERVKGPISL